MPQVYRTILRPLVTERTSAAYMNRGEYAFEVSPEATKHEIKKAVEELFGVHVTSVWTSNHRGQSRRVGTNTGRRAHYKKAIVKLRQGETIEEIFEV